MLSVVGGVATCTISTPRTIEKVCPEKELPAACVPGKIFTIEKDHM